MQLVQDFDSPASPDQVWAALIDIERVTPCLPGARVAEALGDGVYNGSFTAKIGPTKTTMNGELRLTEVDENTRSATLIAEGKDNGGQSKAHATIGFTVSAVGQASRVHVDTQYTIGGRLARFGRGGLIEDVANKILADFSTNLQELLAHEHGVHDLGEPPPGDVADRPSGALEGGDQATNSQESERRTRNPRQDEPQSNLNIGAIVFGLLRDKFRRLFRRLFRWK